MRRADRALLLAVASGGALGALARYGVELGGDVGRDGFQWPTLVVLAAGAGFSLGAL